METKSLERLEKLHPEIREDAILAYKDAVRKTPVGVHPYITDTDRTFIQQGKLYAQGRTTPGIIVTWSKPGESYHNYAMALDFTLQVNGKIFWPKNPPADKNWMIVVECFKQHGFFWGGNFPSKDKRDYPHFQKTFGLTWQILLNKYQNNVFIDGTKFINFNTLI